MKANELRIGNWFIPTMFEGTELEPRQIRAVEFLALSENPNWGKPVSLTQEWLLKFGFEKALNGYWCNKDFMNVKFSPNIEIYLSGDDYDLAHNEFKYVHQLQNLYFALTGEELTYGGNK